MNRSDKLPEGVQPDNRAAGDAASFAAPETAVPGFAAPPHQAHETQTRPELHDDFARPADDDGADNTGERKGPDRALPPAVNNLTMFIAIAALLAGLAAIVVATSRKDLPLCSTQPEWNQYNCRAG